MLLGYWVITLFGEAISGAHFNPAVTLVFMLRKNSKLGSRRLRGLIYIAAQFIGGIISALVSKFLFSNISERYIVSPVPNFKIDNTLPATTPIATLDFAAYISELFGSFYFIFLFMICTDKKTQFSQDRVINCFIIASSYVSSRLIGGGSLVTNIRDYNYFDTTLPQS